jgi:hypothetical protein
MALKWFPGIRKGTARYPQSCAAAAKFIRMEENYGGAMRWLSIPG